MEKDKNLETEVGKDFENAVDALMKSKMLRESFGISREAAQDYQKVIFYAIDCFSDKCNDEKFDEFRKLVLNLYTSANSDGYERCLNTPKKSKE